MILGKQSRQRDTRVVWIFHLVWICRERDLERIPDFFFSSFSEEGEWVIIWPVVNRGRDARVSGEGRRAHEDNLWIGEWIVLSVELLWGTGARFALEVHLICGTNCTVFWMGNRQRGGVRVEFPGYPEVLRPETSCLQVFLSPCGTWWPYVVICLISLARGSLVLVVSHLHYQTPRRKMLLERRDLGVKKKHTVSEAYLALHDTLHEVQNF